MKNLCLGRSCCPCCGARYGPLCEGKSREELLIKAYLPRGRLHMGRAVIVSTARTGLAKSFRGGFNATHGAALGGHAIKHAIAKAGIDPGDVEDVFMGCGMPEGESGMNIARNAALAGGCPVTTSGTTINRFCSSGLQAVAMAAQAIIVDSMPVAIGGGLDVRRTASNPWPVGYNACA